MRVLIIPTHWESQAVLKLLPGAVLKPGWDVPTWHVGDLLLVEPGVGPELTAALLPHVEPLKPQAVWLFGWCGGLVPKLAVGDLVLADATIFAEQDDEPTTQLPHPPPELLTAQVRSIAEELSLRMVVGPVLTSDKVLASVGQKRAGAATGAVAVEMEAGPLARWTVARRVPFVHLRVVLDPIVSALPKTRLPTDEHGRAPIYMLLLHALTHPREWLALWNLIRQARAARRAMANVIAALTRPGGPLAPTPLAWTRTPAGSPDPVDRRRDPAIPSERNVTRLNF